MKKLLFFALVLTMVLASAVPAMAVPSYDSTTMIDVTTDIDNKIFLINGEAVVTYTVSITNISKSGDLPQVIVTPLGDNDLAASKITKINNKATEIFTFTVVYTELGSYDFWVNVKNMQGNSGKWNYEANSNIVTIEVVKAPVNLPDGFTISSDGLNITKDALGFGFNSNGKNVSVEFNGVGLDVNSDVNANNNGIMIKTKVFAVGTYIVSNTDTGESLTFVVELVNGEYNISIV